MKYDVWKTTKGGGMWKRRELWWEEIKRKNRRVGASLAAVKEEKMKTEGGKDG